MRDIRLKEIPFEFDGKLFLLRCNMNVLADVQDAFGGVITDAVNGQRPSRSVIEFLTAMLNDYADEQGWPERYTAKTVGRALSLRQVPFREIMSLVTQAMTSEEAVSSADTEEENTEPGEPGN